MRKSLWLFAFLLATFTAHAQEVEKPAEIAAAIHAATPYGTGTYTYWTIEIYDASLWTDAPDWSIEAPFALSLRYDIAIDKQEFVERSIDEMVKQEPLSEEEINSYRVLLSSLMPKVLKGDRLTALYIPGQNLQIFHNGELTGSTDNMVFARRFLNIWFAPNTSAPDLRNQLLKRKE